MDPQTPVLHAGDDARLAGSAVVVMKLKTDLSPGFKARAAFTLVELLVVIAIIAILAGMLLPALSGAKESGRRIACINHLRQLGLSLSMYADDNDGLFPPRQTPFWMTRLQPYYQDLRLLVCPSDTPNVASAPIAADPFAFAPASNPSAPSSPAQLAATVRRSYVINGWNDYFEAALSPADFATFMAHQWPGSMPESAIPLPSDTITFGEKMSELTHKHMDLLVGSGDDTSKIEEGRHSRGGGPATAGGSDFGFADGSARFLRYGRSVTPVNLWAVTDKWRQNGAVPSP
jgi:prepilin-type N-terminal cleavage/methylation domain-containing protein